MTYNLTFEEIFESHAFHEAVDKRRAELMNAFMQMGSSDPESLVNIKRDMEALENLVSIFKARAHSAKK